MEDAGAAPVLYERDLKSSKKMAGKKASKISNKKASKERSDVCDDNVDMDMNNALMLMMKMESMDKMDGMEADTMSMLAPAVKAVRFFMEEMEEQGGRDTSNVTDSDIFASMMSPSAGNASRNLQGMETTMRSGDRRNLSHYNTYRSEPPFYLRQPENSLQDPSERAAWSMAYYSFAIVLMNAGYTPTLWPAQFGFAEVVADYLCTTDSVSASFYDSNHEVAFLETINYGKYNVLATFAYLQFAAIYDLLGIGKQLSLARQQRALGPLSSDAAIRELCGKLIASYKSGATSTEASSNVFYTSAVAEFNRNLCAVSGSCADFNVIERVSGGQGTVSAKNKFSDNISERLGVYEYVEEHNGHHAYRNRNGKYWIFYGIVRIGSDLFNHVIDHWFWTGPSYSLPSNPKYGHYDSISSLGDVNVGDRRTKVTASDFLWYEGFRITSV